MWQKPVRVFTLMQINKIIDLWLNDIFRALSIKLLYPAPKKPPWLDTWDLSDKQSFAVLLRAIAYCNNQHSFITGLLSIMHSLCSKLSTRAGNRHFAGPLKCWIARLDGDVNRFIAFHKRNIEIAGSRCKSNLGKVNLPLTVSGR